MTACENELLSSKSSRVSNWVTLSYHFYFSGYTPVWDRGPGWLVWRHVRIRIVPRNFGSNFKIFWLPFTDTPLCSYLTEVLVISFPTRQRKRSVSLSSSCVISRWNVLFRISRITWKKGFSFYNRTFPRILLFLLRPQGQLSQSFMSVPWKRRWQCGKSSISYQVWSAPSSLNSPDS